MVALICLAVCVVVWLYTMSAVRSWVLAALKSYNARTDAMSHD